MKFGAPEWIRWLFLILPLAGLFVWMHRRRAARLAGLIGAAVRETVIPGYSERRMRRRTVLRLLAVFCILLALTRPQWGSHWEEVKQRGLDIIVVLDTSKSMLAEDIKPDRLQQAKWAVRDFVRQLRGDRIGLVAFAGSSFLQCPVTVDYPAFTMMLDDLYAGIIPLGGTAIEQALRTAADSFEKTDGADRAILLITDGEDHEGDPLRMAEQLRKDGIKLFCIGVGTVEGELVPSPEGYVRDRQGQIVKSSLNEPLLEKLAAATGGFYVRSAPGDFGLDRIYRLGISGLQRSEQETRLARVYEERFGWFAAAALFFLLAEELVRVRLVRRAAVLLLLTAGAPGAEAAGWEKAYRAGDYSNAFQALEQTVEKFPDIGNYNRGSALYRMGDLQGSEKLYGSAAAQTQNEKLKQKALYNRGTALLAGIAQQSDPSQTDAALAAAEQATGFFEQALTLQPEDLDAKRNLERALRLKQLLEQRKKEQDQQQKQEQKQEQKQDQDQQEQQPDKQNQQPQQKPDQADQSGQPDQQPQQQEMQDQPQQTGQMKQAGEMSKEEAQQLLDAMKQNEQDQRSDLRPFLGPPVRVEKDW